MFSDLKFRLKISNLSQRHRGYNIMKTVNLQHSVRLHCICPVHLYSLCLALFSLCTFSIHGCSELVPYVKFQHDQIENRPLSHASPKSQTFCAHVYGKQFFFLSFYDLTPLSRKKSVSESSQLVTECIVLVNNLSRIFSGIEVLIA